MLRLWPLIILLILLNFLISLTGIIKFSLFDNILVFFGLSGTSFTLKWGIICWPWYISSMMWTLIFYFYLLKNLDKKIVNLIIAILIYFSYSLILHSQNGVIGGRQLRVFFYIFNIGMLRAFGGIGVGYFIGEWYKNNKEKIKNLTLSLKTILIVTALEFGCLYFVIYNLMLHKLKYNNQIIFIIFFAAIIILFLVNKGYISKALNNDFSVFLGKYTYSIYMTHFLIIKCLKGSIWKFHPELVFAHPILNIFITLSVILILGMFTYHCVEKPAAAYIKQKIK